MATHNVGFNLPDRPLGKADIIFNIRKGNNKFGTLRISKGGLLWLPSYKQKGWKMSWSKFNEVMISEGRKRR